MDWVSATVPVAGAVSGRFANERVLTGTEAPACAPCAPHVLYCPLWPLWPLQCGRCTVPVLVAAHRDKVRSTSECGTNCLSQIHLPPRAIGVMVPFRS